MAPQIFMFPQQWQNTEIREQTFSKWSMPRCNNQDQLAVAVRHPCGGGVEYLHRDPASRRRQWKGKSQIWDSKIWSWDQRASDRRRTALATASSIYKIQTRPLVREGVPYKQNRNCQTVINIWSQAPGGCFIPGQTGQLTVGRNTRLRLRLSYSERTAGVQSLSAVAVRI
jgi:hypothetical protein